MPACGKDNDTDHGPNGRVAMVVGATGPRSALHLDSRSTGGVEECGGVWTTFGVVTLDKPWDVVSVTRRSSAWRGAAGLCARVRACAGAAESLPYIQCSGDLE